VRANSTQPGGSGWARCWIEGAGAALLLAPGYIWNQLSWTHLDLYHRLLPITPVVRALAIDVAVLWLLATLVVRLLGWAILRLGGEGLLGPRRGFIGLLWALWLGLLAARIVAGLIVAQVLTWQELSAARAFAVTAGLLVLVWAIVPRGYGLLIRGLRFVVVLLGFSIFWALPVLIVAGYAHQPRDQAEFHKAAETSGGRPRIVWLLFDEMSYDQAFDHRWPGLELPNLDRLRGEGVTFSDMQPDGYFTERIIPSLLLGKPIVDARSTEAGALRYQSVEGGAWTTFDGDATIFADAQRRGWTTGISGDYNPYCRMLENQLDWCSMRLIVFGDHFSRDKTTWENVAGPVEALWARTRHKRFEPAQSEAERFAEMMTAGRELVTDDNIDLAFVHLYLPHPPGFYDRKTGRVLIGGSYIDNMALADRSLGELMQALAQTSRAQSTTLILSSDHSWRVDIWRHAFAWTQEDELASGHGHFDPRPMLMVRFGDQNTAAQVSQPVPLLAMHAMIEKMMAGEIGDEQQLEAWAEKQ
jgi:hypothetical protein